MTLDDLPSWRSCAHAVKDASASELPALENFIYNFEPECDSDAIKFRAGLVAVLDEAIDRLLRS